MTATGLARSIGTYARRYAEDVPLRIPAERDRRFRWMMTAVSDDVDQ